MEEDTNQGRPEEVRPPPEGGPAAEHSFDELAKGLANRSLSRGDALKWVGAAMVGGLLASVPGVAWAHHKTGHITPPGQSPPPPPPPPPPPSESPPPPPPPPPPEESPPPPPPEVQCPPGERLDANCGCIPDNGVCCTLNAVCLGPDEKCCIGAGCIPSDWVCCPTGYACPPGMRCTTDGSSGSDPFYPGCEAA
jgi:hypothetical protein